MSIPPKPAVVKITVDVPADKREAFHALWEKILSDEDDPISHGVEQAQHARLTAREAGVAAIQRLYPVARRDTGRSRVVARFLLGLYNGTRFPFDLTDLRLLDGALFEDCMAVLRMDARHCVQEVHCYFEDGSRKWEQMASDWALVKTDQTAD